jgi:hypothetical protein
MSEADVTLAWRKIYGLIASKGAKSRKAEGYYPELMLRSGYKQEKYYCFVEKGKRMAFCLNIFIHPLSYAILHSVMIKTKSIPFIYHKNCIGYSIFEHNA